MTGKKETGNSWRHTSVIVRADIYTKAHEQGIDISNICNKALADLLGVDYCQQQLDDVPVPRPVIIALNSPPADAREHISSARTAENSPVINADDPAASTAVRSTKRQPKIKPGPKEKEPVPVPAGRKEGVAPAGEAPKPAAGKTQRGDGLKKFVSTKITRSDVVDAVISKDDMYQAFTRFCREHKVTQVPDRKAFTIALKNKFAFFDKTVNGVPSWVNVRLK
ncbi:MAG: hypothetical protein ACYDDV_08970 [Methanoregula sp.]